MSGPCRRGSPERKAARFARTRPPGRSPAAARPRTRRTPTAPGWPRPRCGSAVRPLRRTRAAAYVQGLQLGSGKDAGAIGYDPARLRRRDRRARSTTARPGPVAPGHRPGRAGARHPVVRADRRRRRGTELVQHLQLELVLQQLQLVLPQLQLQLVLQRARPATRRSTDPSSGPTVLARERWTRPRGTGGDRRRPGRAAAAGPGPAAGWDRRGRRRRPTGRPGTGETPAVRRPVGLGSAPRRPARPGCRRARAGRHRLRRVYVVARASPSS